MPLNKQILRHIRNNDDSLTVLYLNSNQLVTAEAQALAAALVKNTALTALDLTGSLIGDGGLQVLAAALMQNTTLKSLNLGINKIGDARAKRLTVSLENYTSLISLGLRENQIEDEEAKALAEVLQKNITLTELDLIGNWIEKALKTQIYSLLERKEFYLEQLQAAACKQLKVAKVLLYKVRPTTNPEPNSYINLPLGLREEIVKHMIEKEYITDEQQRLILNYAEGKIAPVADKLSFFKVTKCDRIRKQLNQDEVEASSRSFTSVV